MTEQQVSKIHQQEADQSGALLAVIERVALNPDADLAKLEKMLAL